MTPLILLAATMGQLDENLTDYASIAMGTFSSEAQHREDPRYDWAEAHLVRIWPTRTDGVWLYQEQTIINREGMTPEQARKAPYFQFVARITLLSTGVLRRDNFRVLEGSRWLGLRAGDPRGAKMSPMDLAPASCHNRIEKVSAGVYIGRTESCITVRGQPFSAKSAPTAQSA